MQHQQRGLGQTPNTEQPDQGKPWYLSYSWSYTAIPAQISSSIRETDPDSQPWNHCENPVQQQGTNEASQDIPKVLLQTPIDFSFPHARGWHFLHGSSHHQDHSKKTNALSDTFWESKHSCLPLMAILGLKLRSRLLPKQPPWGSCCFFSWDAETLSISSLPLLLLILPDFLVKGTAIAWLRGRIISYPSQKCSRAHKELGETQSFVPGHGLRLAKLCHVPRRKQRQEKKHQHQESEAKTAALWWTERGFLQETPKPNMKVLIPYAEEVTGGKIYNFLHGRGSVGSGQDDLCGQGIKNMPRSKVKATTLSDAHRSHLPCWFTFFTCFKLLEHTSRKSCDWLEYIFHCLHFCCILMVVPKYLIAEKVEWGLAGHVLRNTRRRDGSSDTGRDVWKQLLELNKSLAIGTRKWSPAKQQNSLDGVQIFTAPRAVFTVMVPPYPQYSWQQHV